MNETDITASGTTTGTTMGPGHVLAEARIGRNLSLAEVAQQLKLSIWQVEALEADAYDRLPGPVFVRGFVRNYARLLELDHHPLNELLVLPDTVHAASAAVPYSRNIPFPVQRPAAVWPRYVLLLCLLIVGIAIYEALFSGKRQEARVTPSAAQVNVPAAVVQPVTQQEADAGGQQKPPADMRPAGAVSGSSAAEPVVEPSSSPAASQSDSQSPSASVPKSARAGLADVHFRFETESWVEVRDAGSRLLFSQLNPAGTEHHLQARPPLNLIVGNATGVRLEYNGKPFDLKPHTRVDVARFTLE